MSAEAPRESRPEDWTEILRVRLKGDRTAVVRFHGDPMRESIDSLIAVLQLMKDQYPAEDKICVCGHPRSQHTPKPSAALPPLVLACTICECGPGCIHEGFVPADAG